MPARSGGPAATPRGRSLPARRLPATGQHGRQRTPGCGHSLKYACLGHCPRPLHLRRTTVHLVAPGEQILSTTYNNWYAPMDGTSMATPLVAASAALLQSAALRCGRGGGGEGGGLQHLQRAVECGMGQAGRESCRHGPACMCNAAPLMLTALCPRPPALGAAARACGCRTLRPSGCC